MITNIFSKLFHGRGAALMKLQRFVLGMALYSLANFSLSSPVLTMSDAIEKAQTYDPWLLGSEYVQDAQEAESIAAGALPDPTLSFALANLPIDSFDFSQEGMTQVKVGITQMFPRGATLRLKKEKLNILSEQQPFLREDRRQKVKLTVSHLWLEAYRAQESIQLIEKDHHLFEHLVDVAQSSYSSALKNTRQQDLVRAQLELTRLEDRLIQLHQHLDSNKNKLLEWLSDSEAYDFTEGYRISENLPTLYAATTEMPEDKNTLAQFFSKHPTIQGLEKRIDATVTDIQLAKQNYKPQWGVNASYGYRDSTPMGVERSDLFSVGISFDVPLFTTNRQDKKLRSAKSNAEAIKTQKILALRALVSSYESAHATLIRLNQRERLFSGRLLKEMHEQAEASLTAYTNDNGDFAEVVRSRIAELNARIDALNINVNRLKTIAQINYLLAGNEPFSGDAK